MDWIAPLWRSSAFWEGVEYVAEATVITGALFEVLSDFEHILKGDDKRELRKWVEKQAAIALIVGLAVGLGALVRTNELFTETIASLYREARDANDRATTAFDKATKAQDRADKAETESGKANERASKNEKEAARLNKLAEDEKMARVGLQKQLAWRELTDAQLKTIRDHLLPFAGQEFDIVTYAAEPECLNLANRLYAVAIVGKWILDPQRRASALFSLLVGIQVNVAATASQHVKDAASALADSVSREGVTAIVKSVPVADNPPRSGLIVIDIGRNPAGMTPVALPK